MQLSFINGGQNLSSTRKANLKFFTVVYGVENKLEFVSKG